MPTITQHVTINMTPERFVGCCSDNELYELWLVMNTSMVQRKLDEMQSGTAYADATPADDDTGYMDAHKLTADADEEWENLRIVPYKIISL